MSTIILTTGQPGSGKSYSRVRWLCSDFLKNSTGIYITNIPVNPDIIASDFPEPEKILKRLIVIPFDELKYWEILSSEDKNVLKNMSIEEFPPYKFFTQYNLENAHIAIDEFHLYFNKNLNGSIKKLWNDFFAEIRKLGCTFESITQDCSLLPREFVGKVGKWVDLVPLKDLRDPIFKIPLGDWYELRSAYFGLVEQKIQQQEKIKVSSLLSTKWKIINTENFVISSDYFKYYNSYQRNDTGKSSDHKTASQIYGKKTIFWFLRLHFFRLLGKILLAFFIIYLCFFGGILKIINLFTSTLTSMSYTNGIKKNVQTKNKTPIGGVGSDLPTSEKNHEDSAFADSNLNYMPALFFDNRAWLRTGEEVTLNYKFKGGKYDGLQIKKIDAQNRYIVLSDDTILFMYSNELQK